MKITYVGDFAEVVVPMPDGTEVFAKANETVEVADDSYAKRLLEQEANWQPAKAAPVETASTETVPTV